MKDVLTYIRKELEANSDEKTKESGQRYFKEPVQLIGVKTAIVGKIGKRSFEMVKQNPKSGIFQLCEKLWKTGYMEESFIACNWSYFVRKDYKPEDFKIFEKWVNNYVSNWAACDTLCNHTIGEFLEMYPVFIDELKKWTASSNRWVKRASAVSLIIPARKGRFLADVFQIADKLLMDKDDLVQKGYGWMLKAASQAHQIDVFNYVVKNKNVMPRTALRYAIEKMPNELKTIAMKK
ncbi:MAG TPA: DNA alkylation repair protein [Ignavibacteriaceae bacterium]|nr:DNA alkylation repair protein [Ignavibacteriaceae bacterium]